MTTDNKTLADVQPGGRVRLGDGPKDGEVIVEVSGLTGSGKSAIAGEIEILCKALGLDAEWVNGDEEKRLTHADWIGALEMYKPKVVILERNVSRAALSAQPSPGGQDVRAQFEEWAKGHSYELERTGEYYSSSSTQRDWEQWKKSTAEFSHIGQGGTVFQRRQPDFNSISAHATVQGRAWELISEYAYNAYRELMGGNGPKNLIGTPYSRSGFELNPYGGSVEVRALTVAPSAQPSPGGQGGALRSFACEAVEYFRNRSDVVDGDYGSPSPNEEMKLLSEGEAALAARQPVGEPIAWLLINEAGTAIGATRHARERESWDAAGGTTEPLYATPRVQDVDGYQAAFYELTDMLGIPAQPCSPKEVWETQMRPALQAAIAAQGPVPMVLHCPRCHLQHIDAPDERTPDWQNPTHRSHLCHGCGLIWRPADVPTIGVDSTRTAGKSDTPFIPPLSTRPVACLLFDKNGVLRRTRPFTADGKYVFDAATLARLNEGNPQLAPFKAKLVYAGPTTHPADLSEYRDAVMHAYGIVEPDEYYEKLGELLDLIDSQAVGK